MIYKIYNTPNKCTLVFEIPAYNTEATSIELVADFNHWQPIKIDTLDKGMWRLEQEVDANKQYEFRYRILRDGQEYWLSEPEAEGFVVNDRGTKNSIVSC